MSGFRDFIFDIYLLVGPTFIFYLISELFFSGDFLCGDTDALGLKLYFLGELLSITALELAYLLILLREGDLDVSDLLSSILILLSLANLSLNFASRFNITLISLKDLKR